MGFKQQDSVRLLAVDLCIPIAALLTPLEVETAVIPTFRAAVEVSAHVCYLFSSLIPISPMFSELPT